MLDTLGECALNAELLWMSDEWLCASQSHHARNLDSKCPESTGPKDKPASHIKPGALIIQRGDGCRRQINVFYNSTPAFLCNLSCRERIGEQLSVIMHFISPNEQTPETNAIQ